MIFLFISCELSVNTYVFIICDLDEIKHVKT